MKKLLISFLLCLLVIGVGIAVVVGVDKLQPAVANGAMGSPDEPERDLPRVVVAEVAGTRLEDALTLTGQAAPWEDIVISAEARGRVEWQGAEEGTSVDKGAELFRIDTDGIQARVDQAEAQHRLAEKELDRIERLSKSGGSSKQQRDRALADRAVTEAAVKVIRIEQKKSVVRAPFAGVVDSIVTEVGEFADVATPLVRLVQVDKIKVEVGLPERLVPCFSKGDDVSVTLDALPEVIFEGTIHRIATTGDGMTHTFAAEIVIDNGAGRIRPGMTARAKMVRNVFEDAVVVPMFSVLTLNDSRFVFVEREGTAVQRVVETGIFKGKSVQITKGLRTGDRLIVKGQRELVDGAAVQVHEVL